MYNLQRRRVPFLSALLCFALGTLLFLSEPAMALGKFPLSASSGNTLKPHTAYKISRQGTDIESPCFGETAYVRFRFPNEEIQDEEGVGTGQYIFPGGPDDEFSDIYPIQENWDLLFNTALERNDGTWEDLGLLGKEVDGNPVNSCGLTATTTEEETGDTLTLDLLSGFKTKAEAEKDTSGHFVTAKDYWAYHPDAEGTEADPDYEFLGSVTAIGGDNFPALGGAAVGELVIAPHSIRAPHWHLNFAESGYCYSGLTQVGTISPSFAVAGKDGYSSAPRIEEMFVKNGEVFVFPQGAQHYLKNVGNEEVNCVLFFAQDTPINPDQLLTITLQQITNNTPLGTLDSVFVGTPSENDTELGFTDARISQIPDQAYTSTAQGPDVVQVVETCRGEQPNVNDPGCPSYSDKQDDDFNRKRAIFSRLQP